MDIKPLMSCPICGKRIRTTQGLAGHVRFKHPELVPDYERPEFARLNKPLLQADQMLNNLDSMYEELRSPTIGVTDIAETLLRCPCCERPIFLAMVMGGPTETGRHPIVATVFSRVTDEFIKAWRASQDERGVRRGHVECLDLTEAHHEYKLPELSDMGKVDEAM